MTQWTEARVHDGEPSRLPERVHRALDDIDSMPADMRGCVHEFGWEVVSILRNYGLTAGQIATVVHVCWCAPRSPHQRQSFDAPRETRSSPVLQHLDTLLWRSGSSLSGMQVLRFLKRCGMVVVPLLSNTPMVAASCATVAGHDLQITKPEKHRRRLCAAVRAGAARLWPALFEGEI